MPCTSVGKVWKLFAKLRENKYEAQLWALFMERDMRVVRGVKSDLSRFNGIGQKTRPSGRGRLVIVSGKVYELTLKVREGLPFIPTRTMNLLLESAMAQACYVTKLPVCHYVWMANHAHILLVSRDPQSLSKFYGIVKKSLTDFLKRLLGKKQLRIWEGRKVHLIPTPETVLQRIAYFYANPAEADLVDSIEEYPGASSYRDFCMSQSNRFENCDRLVPWIRSYYVPKLKNRVITDDFDLLLESDLRQRAFYDNELLIRPNDWLIAFGLGPEVAERMNSEALKLMREKENEARKRRRKQGKDVLGAAALRRQPIMKRFTPVKDGPCPIVICIDPDVRVKWIRDIQSQRRICAELYNKRYKHGLPVNWPPGVFPSRAPVRACRLV